MFSVKYRSHCLFACSVFASYLTVGCVALEASSVEITKTPDGQKIVTRSGRSTDITIQSNGSKSNATDDDFDDESDRSSASRSSSNSKKKDVPTEEEFKERMRSRMRSVSP